MVKQFCDSCGAELIPGKEFCPKCLLRVAVVVPVVEKEVSKKQYPKDTPENRAKKMKEFKVFVIKDALDLVSGGQFNAKKIEDELNSYGSDGWSVKEIATRQIPGIASLTYEMVIILERDMPLVP